MSWVFSPAFDAAQRAALEHGKPLVYVCPPAGWAVAPLFASLPEEAPAQPATLVLAPESGDVLDTARALRTSNPQQRVHPLTGLSRAERLLQRGVVSTIVATPPDALYLVRRSALKLDHLSRVAVLWPEAHATLGVDEDLEALLGDARDAQHLIATTDEGAVGDFIERHARRAPVAVLSRIPEAPVQAVQYAVVPPHARLDAARAALDILAPTLALVWDPLGGAPWREVTAPDLELIQEADAAAADLVIAADLPSAEALASLGAVAPRVLVLLRASQLPYLQRITKAAALRLPGHTDRVRSAAVKLQTQVRARLEGAAGGGRGEGGDDDLSASLIALDSLLEEYDPAQVAAAALALGGRPPDTAPADGEPPPGTATWTRLFVTAGRRDRVGPGDLLGVLLRAAELHRADVGRIEVRESFTLVEVRPEVADHAIRSLSGEKIRGRRVTARLDRHESSDRSRST